MANIKHFTFNAFQENTYIIWDDSKESILIDPGCSNTNEEEMLKTFIQQEGLKPVKLLNTHCHIDHVLGNYFCANHYKLNLEIHPEELKILHGVAERAISWGIPYTPSPEPAYFLRHGETISFGNTNLELRFVPGHAPGHIVLVNHTDRTVIAGDTLFKGSIGRTDLPFGDFDALEKHIRSELYSLPDNYTVYPGHGESTTIGFEKANNPFIHG